MSKKNKVISFILGLGLIIGVVQIAPTVYNHIEDVIQPTKIYANEKPSLNYRKATVINKNEYSPSFDMLTIVKEKLDIEDTSDYYINVLLSNNTINTFRVTEEEYLNANADDNVYVVYNTDGQPKYIQDINELLHLSDYLNAFLPENKPMHYIQL